MQGALAPMMQYWARAENGSASFEWALPKNMISGLYECADGRWLHTVGKSPEAAPLMAETIANLGEEQLSDARRRLEGWLANPTAREPEKLVAGFLCHDSRTWLAALREADVAVMDAADPGDVLFDEQARLNGFVVPVPQADGRSLWQAGTPFRTEPRSRVHGPAPALDAHGAELRAESRPAPSVSPRGAAPERYPLEGIKLLDLGNFLAGPFGPMLMADLGADVIKLEATTGDRMRYVAARSFAGCQRGKRAIALDLKDPRSRPGAGAAGALGRRRPPQPALSGRAQAGDRLRVAARGPPDAHLLSQQFLRSKGAAQGLAGLRPDVSGHLGLGDGWGRRGQPAHLAPRGHDGPPERHGIRGGGAARAART